MTAPDPPGKTGIALSLIGRVLDYMQRPWQALAVMALVLICGAGWLAWSERAELIAVLKNRPAGPVVLKADLLPTVNGLLNDTTADMIAVWRVDFAVNLQFYVLSSRRGDGNWAPELRVLPALTAESDMKRTVKLLYGQAVCGDATVNPSNLLLRRLVADGYRWLCIVPVPPDPNVLTAGVIYLAWKSPPDAANEAAARAAALAAADNMVLR